MASHKFWLLEKKGAGEDDVIMPSLSSPDVTMASRVRKLTKQNHVVDVTITPREASSCIANILSDATMTS